MVVLGHVYRNDFAVNWIYSFHMPVFFFAAGYMYKEKPVLQDIKRRTQTVLLPYFVFGTLILIYWILIERRFRESSMTLASAIVGFIRGQEVTLDFNVHLWFLPCFFVVAVAFNALVKDIGKEWTYIIIAGLSVVYAILQSRIPSLPWGVDRACKYTGFYTIGHVTACKLGNKGVGGVASDKLSLFRFFIGLGVLVAESASVYFIGRENFAWFLNATIGIAGLTIISMAIKSRLIEYLGRCTIVILCFHGPIYRVVIQVISVVTHLDTEVVRENLLLALLIVGITLVVCLIIYQFVVRFFPWVIGKRTVRENVHT